MDVKLEQCISILSKLLQDNIGQKLTVALANGFLASLESEVKFVNKEQDSAESK